MLLLLKAANQLKNLTLISWETIFLNEQEEHLFKIFLLTGV